MCQFYGPVNLSPHTLVLFKQARDPGAALNLEYVSKTDMYNSRHVAEENMEEKTNLYNNHISKRVQSIAIAPSYLQMHDKCWDLFQFPSQLLPQQPWEGCRDICEVLDLPQALGGM